MKGRASARTIASWSLPSTRLVVLAACDTANGGVYRGEGIMGLTRAFLAARVPSVIGTLWQVDDWATARLMNEFYRSLTHGEDAATALATAQRRLLATEGTAAPVAWAGFALVGAGETRAGGR